MGGSTVILGTLRGIVDLAVDGFHSKNQLIPLAVWP